MDKKVNEYIEKQEAEKRAVCLRLREIIMETFPGLDEEMKWGVPVYGGGKFYIGAVKHGVNLGFSVVELSEKERGLFGGSGKMMRHIKVISAEEVDEERIVRLLKLIMKKEGKEKDV